jgi:hypothetical protein
MFSVGFFMGLLLFGSRAPAGGTLGRSAARAGLSCQFAFLEVPGRPLARLEDFLAPALEIANYVALRQRFLSGVGSGSYGSQSGPN